MANLFSSYLRRCKYCNTLYRTQTRGSRVCPDCAYINRYSKFAQKGNIYYEQIEKIRMRLKENE